MTERIQAVRGMHDVLPEATALWRWVEDVVMAVFASYGYEEIRVPILERSELYGRSIGQATDIVEKEMYTFEDRNGESLSLRPEGTAGCVRAGIEQGLLYNQIQRFWYGGPMFRHERPQKGRLRQFHQLGVEAFGMPGPDIDAELILMTARLWRELGLEGLELQVNSLGAGASRIAYRERLVEYFSDHVDDLDEDSQRRLTTNPLRILDSKHPRMQLLIEGAPKLTDFLDPQASDHLDALRAHLDAAGVSYVVNPRLVRGLDYYCKTVFEWMTHELGAQGTVCAGGRYDDLVQQVGGAPTPAAGFAVGLERLVALLENRSDVVRQRRVDGYLVCVGEIAERHSLVFAERVREAAPGLRLRLHCGGGNFKRQMKQADRSGALFALILGDEEARHQQVAVKSLRESLPQQTWAWDTLFDRLRDIAAAATPKSADFGQAVIEKMRKT